MDNIITIKGEQYTVHTESRSGGCKDCYFDADRSIVCDEGLQRICNKGLIFSKVFPASLTPTGNKTPTSRVSHDYPGTKGR